jgi:hypothetical protein
MACTSPVRYSVLLNLVSTRWYCLFIATIQEFVHQIHSVVAEIWRLWLDGKDLKYKVILLVHSYNLRLCSSKYIQWLLRYDTQYSCMYVFSIIIFCMVLSKNSYKQEYPSSIQGLCHQTTAFISQQPLNGFWWINSGIVAMNRQYHLVLTRFGSTEYLTGLVHAMRNNGPL